ncbi:MAG: efflux RND transporter periplasmic adaptor subunit [Chloroflexota bacterium]
MQKRSVTGIILIGLLVLIFTSCSGGTTTNTEAPLAKVTRGDLTLIVSGSGNIKPVQEVNLAFPGAGRVARVFVEEGDQVKAGDKLAQLDTGALQLARDQAQVSWKQAGVSLTQAKLAEITAANTLRKTRESQDTLELALLKAKIDVDSARFNLEQTTAKYTRSDIRIAQADVDDAQRYVDYILEKLENYQPNTDEGYTGPVTDTEGFKVWQERLVQAQARLQNARDTLDALLGQSDPLEVSIKKQQLEAAQMSVTQAQQNLTDLADDIAFTEAQLEAAGETTAQAETSVAFARQSLAQAQQQLDEATITAPFAGVVASVGAKEDERITSANTIVHLMDTGTLELVVEMDEIDIPNVASGQEANIDVDALPDTAFSGEVVYVYPVPFESGGIVLFNTKIEINIPPGSPLRVGMSATADIITAKRTDVLQVPSRAVYRDDNGQYLVKVRENDQDVEKPVVPGIDNGIMAEIVSGLSEGETVVVETRPRQQQGLSFF